MSDGGAAALERYRFPLSSGQARLWILDQLQQGGTAYNLRFAVRLDQEVQAGALQRALNAVVERHEVLRTVFEVVEGEPAQVVLERMPVRMAAFDLRKLPAARRQAEAARLAAQLADRPFDLAKGPLLRAALMWLGPAEFVLAMAVHHIVADAWSMGVLATELGALYEGETLAPPPLQYADYAVWQRDAAAAEQLDYWRDALAGAEELAPPFDRPRPAVQAHHGAGFGFELREDTIAGLQRVGLAEGATLFMVLLAAWAATLARWCEQDDLMIGAPVAGRDRPELESLIGFFVNTLVLRVDARGDPPFRTLLERVREVALGGYAHAGVPFDKLVEALAPQRDLSRNPLFQVTFQLYESPTAPDAIALRQQLDMPVSASLFDLRVDLFRGPSGLSGRVEYDTALFDEPSVRWVTERFSFICEQVARDPDRRLSALDWVPPAQRALLERFNATTAPVATGTVPERIADWAAREPARTAVADGGGAWSFAELDDRAGRLAGALARDGVGRGDVVAVNLPRGRAFVAAALAAMRLGAAYLPLDVAYPAARLERVLADARPAALVATAPLGDVGLVGVDPWPDAPAPPVRPGELAYVIYTSGSTGTPKGVEVEHGGLMNLVSWHQRAYGLTPEDRGAQISSVGFDAAVWEIWPQLYAGGSLHVCDDETRGDADALLAWLRDERISLCFIPTPLAELVLDRPWPAHAPLRHLLTGGDTLRRGANPRHPYALVNHYGPTEHSVVATAGPVTAADDRPSIGAPIANTTAYVVDGAGGLAGLGQPGELLLGGPSLARGYHHDDALTRERFVPNAFAEDPPRLYRTGDRVRWRPDGTLAFLGRTDSQIKVRGHRIEPREIETLLASHPRIAQAVVSATPELTVHLVASGPRPDARALRQWLRQRLPAPMVPTAYAFVDEWPLTPNGKLDHAALPAARSLNEPGEPSAESADALEQALCRLFEHTLGVDRVGVEDDFFARGGHSLLATQLVTRIRDGLGVDLALRALFERPTPTGLAALLRRNAPDAGALARAAEALLQVLALSDDDVEALLQERE